MIPARGPFVLKESYWVVAALRTGWVAVASGQHEESSISSH
ncbi:MAG TPA: hypothetical protein VKM93_28505 [Terriglobia bacterium]|nr:hypothetical protein [Terriglobia bacterium]